MRLSVLAITIGLACCAATFPVGADIESSIAAGSDPNANLSRLMRALRHLQQNNPSVDGRNEVLNILDNASNAQQVRRSLRSLLPEVTRQNMLRERSVPAFNSRRTKHISRLPTGERSAYLQPFSSNLVWLDSTDRYQPTTDFWLQTWVDQGTQDDADGFDGFDSESRGFAIGVDYNLSENLALGISAGRNNGEVSSDIFGDDEQYSNEIAVAVFYEQGIHSFSGSFKHSKSEVDRERIIIVDTDTASRSFRLNSDFQSTQNTLSLGYSLFLTHSDSFTFSPYLLATYSHLAIDNYIERGRGSLALIVETDNEAQLIGTLGANMSWSWAVGEWLVAPHIGVAIERDFRADVTTTFSRFSDAPTSLRFQTTGYNVEQNRWRYAFGISALHTKNVSVSINYEGQRKSDYKYDAAIINLRIRI
ncbi:MAG: autotransporter outer membrane beta-barrel domain-containing protein [Gammaproteobacteria bacterium]|nr:autotransporter outer membrane beta-barrel domain-containing protein [Gammaproteobacteria bacterium]